jgi:hypothetical protein
MDRPIWPVSNRLSTPLRSYSAVAMARSRIPSAFHRRGPGFLASGDFNGDGKPDIAILFDSTNTLAILLGSGDGFWRGL